jgi:hypothetical protein
MKRILIEVQAILVAAIASLGILFVIFAAPTWIYGKEIILAWMFYFWIPGLPISYWVGGFVRRAVRNLFLPSIEESPNK